jgi:uncharacterized membrane protein
LQEYRHFRIGGYDLAIFDQAVRGYAHFQAPTSLIKGVHDGFGPNFSILGDHFSPVIALVAPVYWVWANPAALIIVQSVLFALAVPLMWVTARRLLGGRAAWIVAVAYALSWGLQGAVAVGFHEIAFAVPLIALMLERWTAGRLGQAILAALALLFVKEDMGLIVAALGAVLFVDPRARGLMGERRRIVAPAALFVGGLIVTILTIKVVIPAFGGRSGYYWDEDYGALGASPAAALKHVVIHPLDTLHLLVTPAGKWQLLLWLILPFALLPLASPYSLLAVPFLLERLFSANANHWSTLFHYNSILMPIMFVAAMDGLLRVRRHFGDRVDLRRSAVGWSAAVLVVAVVISAVHFPYRRLIRPSEWTTSARDRAAAEAVALVPDGAMVEATNFSSAHLTGRTHVMLFDDEPRGADWIVVDTLRNSFPFDNVEVVRSRVAELPSLGYEQVYSQDGFSVWRLAR